MALFIPTSRDINAEDLARIFLSQVFAKHGTRLTSSPTEANTSSRDFGSRSANCWESKRTFRLPTIQSIFFLFTQKVNNKFILNNSIFFIIRLKVSVTSSHKFSQGFCQPLGILLATGH